jgi:predicted lipid-binding transport protein (Tim44 family)
MAPRGVVVRNLHISKAPPRTTARTSRAARRSYARPAGSGVRVGCQLLGRFLDGLSLTSSLDGAKAEAMAMSASKRTLCLRRSILRMRFIAIASRSGSVVSVALSS